MFRSMLVALIVAVLVAKAATGLRTSLSWETEKDTQTFSADATKSYEVRTDNGAIEFVGQSDSTKKAEIVAIRKARASDEQRAKEALNAIEITIDGKGTETCRIGWRWRRPKEPDWNAAVDFQIHAPKAVDLKAESENGRISVENLAGNAALATKNGTINADTAGHSLDLRTQNGEIRAKCTAQTLKIQSQNGHVTADLSKCGKVEGTISTINGFLEVSVGKDTSCELTASTQNGIVTCRPHLKDATEHGRSRKRPRTISGTLGSGGGRLSLTCVNGAIHIDD